jgi:hypothetical protein
MRVILDSIFIVPFKAGQPSFCSEPELTPNLTAALVFYSPHISEGILKVFHLFFIYLNIYISCYSSLKIRLIEETFVTRLVMYV